MYRLQGHEFAAIQVNADKEGATVKFEDGSTLRVASDWTPGDQLAVLDVDGSPLVLKVGKVSGGFRIRNRGAGHEGSWCAVRDRQSWPN